MHITLGLFALSLLGAEGPRNREAPEITYEVRVVKMQGLEWRREYFPQLQPVTTQAGATVWTTTCETADELAAKDPDGQNVPRVTAPSQAPATFLNRANRKVASGVNRLADGPFDHATKVAYTPHYEEIRDGFALTMSGRKIDQGVLACVVLDETRVANVHQIDLAETLAAKACCAKEGEGSHESQEAAGKDKIASRIEIPEVVRNAVAGEWLIPNDGALVVSLGVQTTADGSGKAVPVERLMLIEATPIRDGAVRQAALSGHPWIQVPNPGLATKPATAPGAIVAPNPMPMPAVPSRSLPQALAADGTPMPLPPLPEEKPAPSALPGSSEPCASPQGTDRRQTPEPPSLDPASTRTGFTLTPKAAELINLARPLVVRFPINAGNINMEVEIRASMPSLNPGKPRTSTSTQPEN